MSDPRVTVPVPDPSGSPATLAVPIPLAVPSAAEGAEVAVTVPTGDDVVDGEAFFQASRLVDQVRDLARELCGHGQVPATASEEIRERFARVVVAVRATLSERRRLELGALGLDDEDVPDEPAALMVRAALLACWLDGIQLAPEYRHRMELVTQERELQRAQMTLAKNKMRSEVDKLDRSSGTGHPPGQYV
jgi:hypothetical protein